jgi:hypothetical protein
MTNKKKPKGIDRSKAVKSLKLHHADAVAKLKVAIDANTVIRHRFAQFADMVDLFCSEIEGFKKEGVCEYCDMVDGHAEDCVYSMAAEIRKACAQTFEKLGINRKEASDE